MAASQPGQTTNNDGLPYGDEQLETVAIFGVGLIGGSFGLALRSAGFTGEFPRQFIELMQHLRLIAPAVGRTI
jgi:hypothetical protein